jgi:hypothetical protein
MGYQFYACDWLIRYETINVEIVDKIFDAAVRLNCHIYLLNIWSDERDFTLQKFGVAALSEEHLREFTRSIRCKISDWYPITMEVFLKGRELKLTDAKERGSWLRTVEYVSENMEPESREFHQRINTDWKDWTVFRVNLKPHNIPATRQEADKIVNQWRTRYDTAREMGSIIGFIERSEEYRLFLPLPDVAQLQIFVHRAAPYLPVSMWLSIQHNEVPNLLRTHNWQFRLLGPAE